MKVIVMKVLVMNAMVIKLLIIKVMAMKVLVMNVLFIKVIVMKVMPMKLIVIKLMIIIVLAMKMIVMEVMAMTVLLVKVTKELAKKILIHLEHTTTLNTHYVSPELYLWSSECTKEYSWCRVHLDMHYTLQICHQIPLSCNKNKEKDNREKK